MIKNLIICGAVTGVCGIVFGATYNELNWRRTLRYACRKYGTEYPEAALKRMGEEQAKKQMEKWNQESEG